MATSAAAAASMSAWAPAASSSTSSSSMVGLGFLFASVPFVVCTSLDWEFARAVAGLNTVVQLPLTSGNVESILDEVRPYLLADGGDVALHEINGNVVRLKLQGACGSCPSSVTTMKMSIQRRLMENILEISAVERVADKEMGLKLNEANVQKVLAEIRPYLAGKGGGELEFIKIVGHIVKVRFTGRAAGVKTVRVALTQKLREKIPSIAAIRVLS
ncbi:unnamed protein product [Miscanthus lutarioriparius]|uniref:NIF system FeS cluster assembly NifU C-terminal domain-containing protein n=1 Tax=Miscanthus lutarioriparius TaxID=422564 RepID=A0A811RD76_9POAL|nr:unnamed protein product [Miscanthus lutarioriparius]